MKLNLLATTTAAALLASGAVWAQAPGPQDHKDKANAEHRQDARKQNPGDHQQSNAAKQGEPNARHAEEKPASKPNAQTGQNEPKNAPGAEHAQKSSGRDQNNKPDAAAANNEKQGPNRNSNVSLKKDEDAGKNAASKSNRHAKNKAGDQKDKAQQAQQKNQQKNQQNADQSRPNAQQDPNAANANKAATANNKPQAPDAKSKQSAGRQDQKQNASQQDMNKNAKQNAAQDANRSTGQNQQATSTSPSGEKSASTRLSETDRSKLVSKLKSETRATNQHVNIDVNVGTRLPPRIHARRLPSSIVSIVPEYRGYDYVMVRDEIAIIRPGTREVVDVIREGGPSYARTESTETFSRNSKIHLSDQQKQAFIREARPMTSSQVSSSGSSCLSYQAVPESLASQNPELKDLKYLAVGNQIVLVDPKDQKIVNVIQQ